MVTLFILIVLYLVYDLSGNFIMVLVGILIFLITLSTFYFPTRYSVDEKIVTIKYVFSAKSRNLSAFRSVFPGLRGVLLSPYLAPSRLENFRGFYLRYGKDNKAEVDSFLRDLLGEENETNADESSRADG